MKRAEPKTEKQKSTLQLDFGALADPLDVQLKEAGHPFDEKEAAHLQRVLEAAHLLHIHSYIRPSEYYRVLKRVLKEVTEMVRREMEKGATHGQDGD